MSSGENRFPLLSRSCRVVITLRRIGSAVTRAMCDSAEVLPVFISEVASLRPMPERNELAASESFMLKVTELS